MAAALAAGHLQFVMFVELQFTSGTQRYSTAGESITWSGYTWVGVGALANMREIRESESLEAIGVEITLSSIPSSILALALGEDVQGKTCKIYSVAMLNGVIQDTPPVEYIGRVDTLAISENGKSGSITVNVESRLADFARPRVRRYTDQDQQALYPGDLFFQFVAQMPERQIVWPAKEFFKK